MDTWSQLEQWAANRLPSLVITLIAAGPEDDGGLVGRTAILRETGGEPQGHLTAAPFWSGDWEASLAGLTAELPPDEGRLAECRGRRYLVSSLVFSRSALVLGGGHVGEALSRVLRFLDFQTTLMDDRRDFLQNHEDGVVTLEAPFERLTELFASAGTDAVIIVTRGHAQDSACLRQALSWARMPSYLGMIGSRHRTSETLKMLTAEGFPPERLARVHTPVGLKIGAQTPAEIAISIAAEIIQVLNARA